MPEQGKNDWRRGEHLLQLAFLALGSIFALAVVGSISIRHNKPTVLIFLLLLVVTIKI
jgi:hypothetical protein